VSLKQNNNTIKQQTIMKNNMNNLKTLALAAITVTIALAGRSAPAVAPNAIPTQPDFPQIILQPEDQMVPFASNATFSVTALNTDAYQWLRNGNPLAGQTNTSLTISDCGLSDVGYYSCNLFKDIEVVPTRSAELTVYTNSIDPQTGVDPGRRVWPSGAWRRFARFLPRTLCRICQLHQDDCQWLGLGTGHQQQQHRLHRLRHQPHGHQN
jgi:hypothetical protein